MANPANIADLEARWRPLTAAEQVVAQAALGDAWALLTVQRPTLDANLQAGAIPFDAAVFVVCSMVLRALKNPDGKAEESVDDYRYKRDSSVASGALYASVDELALVTPVTVARSRSVRLVAYGDL